MMRADTMMRSLGEQIDAMAETLGVSGQPAALTKLRRMVRVIGMDAIQQIVAQTQIHPVPVRYRAFLAMTEHRVPTTGGRRRARRSPLEPITADEVDEEISRLMRRTKGII